MKNKQNQQNFSSRTLFQSIFLTSDLFVDNSLLQSASSCAFGFLFSLLPVILLILIVLTRILHTNQDILAEFYPYLQGFLSKEQYETITDSVLEIKKSEYLKLSLFLQFFGFQDDFSLQ